MNLYQGVLIIGLIICSFLIGRVYTQIEQLRREIAEMEEAEGRQSLDLQ